MNLKISTVVFTFFFSTIMASSTYAIAPTESLNHTEKSRSEKITGKCTSTPCSNSATGEDRQDIAIRNARHAQEKLDNSGDDSRRWKRPLYSDSTRADDLTVDLIREEKFFMKLSPVSGQISFSMPDKNDTFEIERPIGSANGICPEYSINVVKAAKTYALLRKSCMKHEYKPGRFAMGATYYLYDSISHTTRTIWESQANGQNDPFPKPKTEPNVTTKSNGLQIDWKTTYPFEGRVQTLTMKTRYVHKSINGKLEFVCTDLLAPDGENLEVGACEGGVLPRVTKSHAEQPVQSRQ